VLDGLALAAQTIGLDTTGLLGATMRIVHVTTVATNTPLERTAARVGMLTTEGHRAIIEMREGLKQTATICAWDHPSQAGRIIARHRQRDS
jgi:N-methylhydantoinase A